MKFYLLGLGDIWDNSKALSTSAFKKNAQQSTYNTERSLLFLERAFTEEPKGTSCDAAVIQSCGWLAGWSLFLAGCLNIPLTLIALQN